MANTHRAVIEGSVPPFMTLIAAGGEEFCSDALAAWIVEHPLNEFETALVLEVTATIKEGATS